VDQAILYTQLGANNKGFRDVLRLHGIRTATSFLEVSAAIKKQQEKSAADDTTSASAMEFDSSLEVALSTNSNLALVQRWRTMSPAQACSPDQAAMEQAA
jgi:hypothetical protein